MKNLAVCCMILVLGSACSKSSNSLVKTMETVNTLEEAEALREKHPEWEMEIMEMVAIGSPNELLGRLLKGEVVTATEDSVEYSHKLVSLDTVRQYHVSYILFSSTDLSAAELKNMRKQVWDRYRKGQSFQLLANQFTMDGNTNGGEMGWMDESQLFPQFVAAIKAHKKGEVFTVDIPDQNLYFLLLKRDDERIKLSMQILKVKNPGES